MKDIFISYRHETCSEFASFLTAELTRQGFEVFLDYYSLHQGSVMNEVDRAIADCSYFLLLLAPGDIGYCLRQPNPEKEWIIYESQQAVDNSKIIIPIAVKKCTHKDLFPDCCKSIPVLKTISELLVCELFGSNAAELISSRLIKEFIISNPSKLIIDKYNNGIIDPDFVKWEIETLKSIYYDISLVNVFGSDYPVTAIKGSPNIRYPFDDLTPNGSLNIINDPFNYTDNLLYNDFKKIVGPNIHFPELLGFTSNGFELDENGNIKSISSTPRPYKETVYTSHILDYELYRMYQSIGKSRLATLDDLPIRKAIHNGLANKDVILSGCNRSALNDICIAVMDYNEITQEYDIAIGERSENVAVYPGYLSIIPSGGFELYELETSQSEDTIRLNYRIIGALFREYLEELFGDESFEKPTGDDDLNRLFKNRKIWELNEGIKTGKFKMEFLGVAFDLIILRQTLVFALRIDDRDYFYNSDIRKNSEHSFIKFKPLRGFEDSIKRNGRPVLCESAAVFSLLKESKLYTDIAKNNFQLL